MAAVVRAGTKLGVTVVEAAKPRLANVWKYSKVEMRPPGPSEWGAAAAEAGQFVKSLTTGKFLQQTTTEAMTNAVVIADVAFCFFIGEVIGRKSLIGYNIKGAHM